MPSRAQGLETRARLVQAATEAFAQRGVRDTSLNAVAEAAGVTRQGLLHYFPSKTDLLLAVLEQRDIDDAKVVPHVVAQAGDLGGALLAIMRHNQEEAGLTQLFAAAAAEGARSEEPTYAYFRQRYERNRGLMADAISRQQARGDIRADLDPELLAVALLSLLHGLNLHQLLEPEIDHVAAFESILRLLV